MNRIRSYRWYSALLLLLLAGGALGSTPCVLLAQPEGAPLAPSSAPAYAVSYWTVDGGGGLISGPGYALEGSAGQPEAGALSGGGLTLYGGFWGGGAVAAPGPRLFLPLLVRHP